MVKPRTFQSQLYTNGIETRKMSALIMETYEFTDGDGNTQYWDINMANQILDNLMSQTDWAPTAVDIRCLIGVLENPNINQERIHSPELDMQRPLIMAIQPDDSAILIDGTHRLLRHFMLQHKTVPVLLLSDAENQCCLISKAEFERVQLATSSKANMGVYLQEIGEFNIQTDSLVNAYQR